MRHEAHLDMGEKDQNRMLHSTIPERISHKQMALLILAWDATKHASAIRGQHECMQLLPLKEWHRMGQNLHCIPMDVRHTPVERGGVDGPDDAGWQLQGWMIKIQETEHGQRGVRLHGCKGRGVATSALEVADNAEVWGGDEVSISRDCSAGNARFVRIQAAHKVQSACTRRPSSERCRLQTTDRPTLCPAPTRCSTLPL
jgi:hypothetical protein